MSRVLIALASVTFLATVSSAQTRPIPADTMDRARRCVFTQAPKESLSNFLQRCAEEFVARNGYTAAPPTSDSTLWAPESIEFASSWQEALQHRHNRLKRLLPRGC